MQRIQKIRSILEEKQIDAILIKSRSNKRYLGALTGSGVKVLVTRDALYPVSYTHLDVYKRQVYTLSFQCP